MESWKPVGNEGVVTGEEVTRTPPVPDEVADAEATATVAAATSSGAEARNAIRSLWSSPLSLSPTTSYHVFRRVYKARRDDDRR
jgi:hypothetical protein